MKKKPHWFSLRDLAFMTGPGVLSIVFAGMLISISLEAAALCAVVGAAFITIWVLHAMQQKKRLAKFRWYPTYGFMVKGDGYNLPTDEEFDASVKRTVDAWSAHLSLADAVLEKEVVWCWMKKDLDENERNLAHQKVEGFTIVGTYCMFIDYDLPNDPFLKTSFEHELGHILYGHSTGDWGLASSHEFAKLHGLR